MPSPEPPAGAPESPPKLRRIWPVTLAAGIVAGLLAGAAGELTYPIVHQDIQYPASLETMTNAEKLKTRAEVRLRWRVVDQRNQAAAAFGLLGVLLGLVMGLEGRRTSGPGPFSIKAAIVGGLLGGLAGAGLSIGLVPGFFETADGQTGLPLLFLTHAAIFGGVATASGVAFGLGWGGRRAIVRSVIGGLLGSFIGTFVCEVINFVAFPLLRMYDVVPRQTVPRLIVHLWVAGCTGLFIGLFARKLRPRQS